MSGTRVTIDGLWRCLCPSIDVTLTRRVTNSHSPCRARAAASAVSHNGPGSRCFHADGRGREKGAKSNGDPFTSLGSASDKEKPLKLQAAPDWLVQEVVNQRSQESPTPRPTDNARSHTGSSSQAPAEQAPGNEPAASFVTAPAAEHASGSEKGPADMVQRLIWGEELSTNMSRAAKEEIYDALRKLRAAERPKHRMTAAALVKHLLASGTAPDTFIYETLLMAHSATDGSADAVKELLREMRDKKLPWSSTAYHAALQALAIHPDYLLRNTIIKEMKERWIEISPEGHQHIAVGLLRDEQWELALEKLHEMCEKGIEIEGWVYDIFTYVLGRMEFLDDAVRIVRHRLDKGHEVPVNVWYFLLDVCSKDQNMAATRYIWNRAVQQGIINPSDGVALNVLNVAAVYGDTELATTVIGYLASRGTRLTRYHYEALIDAYCAQGDVEKAVEAYCIMQAAGVEVNHSSTSSLAFALTRDRSLIDQAIQAISGLQGKHRIPINLFNCVLNEIVKADVEQPDDAFAKALGLYRRVREFVPAGPNWETFRNLLWKCTRPDVAQFFAGEMIHFGISENLVIKKHMFRINVEFNGPSHRAKDYFFRVAPHFGGDLSTGSRKAEVMDLSVKLIKRLIRERDREAWRILDICKKNGLEEETINALRAEVEAGNVTRGQENAAP